MIRSVPVAVAGGFAAGVLFTLAATPWDFPFLDFDDQALIVVAGVLPTAAGTVFGLLMVRRWLSAHEARASREIADLAEQRRLREEEHVTRLAEIDAREAQVRAVAAEHQEQLAFLVQQLDNATHADTRRALAQLQTQYDELAQDHNTLISDTMQERASRFYRRPRPGCIPPQVTAPAILLPAPAAAVAQAPDHRHARDAPGDAG